MITDQNIYFNWIPKTAGSSIYSFLSNHFDCLLITKISDANRFTGKGCVSFRHMSYLNLLALNIIPDSFHNDSFKFSIVRCPYTRTLSLYNFCMRKHEGDWLPLNVFLKKVCLKNSHIGLYDHVFPPTWRRGITNHQADYLMWHLVDKVFWTDKIYKFENLEEFRDDFYKRYNVKFDPTIKENVTDYKFTMKDLLKDTECIDLINKIYYRDFIILNYDFF